jgi:hypothetical protein
MSGPLLAVIAAIVMTFALPPSNEKQKFVAIPIGLGVVISIAMLVNLLLKWERGGPFSSMANGFTGATFFDGSNLLWSAITIVISVVPEWRSSAKYVVLVPIFFAICFYAFLFTA